MQSWVVRCSHDGHHVDLAIWLSSRWWLLALRPGSQWRCAVAEIIRRDAGRKVQGAHNSPNDPDFLRLIEKHLVDQQTTSLVSLMFAVFTPRWALNEHRIPKLQMSETGTTCERSGQKVPVLILISFGNRTATGNGSQQRTCFQRACRAAEPKCPNLDFFWICWCSTSLSVWFYPHSNFWNTKHLEPWFAIGSVSQFDLSVLLELLSPLKVKHFSELLASRDRQRERE